MLGGSLAAGGTGVLHQVDDIMRRNIYICVATVEKFIKDAISLYLIGYI